MKRTVVIICCLIAVDAFACLLTPDEVSVATHLVQMIMSSPEWDDVVSTNVSGAVIVPYFENYEDLFATDFPSNSVGSTWTPSERRAAFENYIYAIPDLSTNKMDKGVSVHGGVALSFCREHGVSNVLHSAMRILISPHSVAQSSALGVFEEFAVPTDDVNALAAQILTNKTAETEHFRKYFLGAYARVLQKHKDNCRPYCLTNGISIAISGVYGWAGVVSLDKLLIDVFPEYGTSSNRLAVASSALAADYPNELFWDWRTPIQEYFAPITNQLLNISQPLPEVEALRGL